MVTSSRKQPEWRRTRSPIRFPNSRIALLRWRRRRPPGCLRGCWPPGRSAGGRRRCCRVDGGERTYQGVRADDQRQLPGVAPRGALPTMHGACRSARGPSTTPGATYTPGLSTSSGTSVRRGLVHLGDLFGKRRHPAARPCCVAVPTTRRSCRRLRLRRDRRSGGRDAQPSVRPPPPLSASDGRASATVQHEIGGDRERGLTDRRRSVGPNRRSTAFLTPSRSEASAASSTATTRSPMSPPVIGRCRLRMHSRKCSASIRKARGSRSSGSGCHPCDRPSGTRRTRWARRTRRRGRTP